MPGENSKGSTRSARTGESEGDSEAAKTDGGREGEESGVKRKGVRERYIGLHGPLNVVEDVWGEAIDLRGQRLHFLVLSYAALGRVKGACQHVS